MKSRLYHLARAAGLVVVALPVVVVLNGAAAGADSPGSFKHAPVQVRRNPDGSLKRGLRNEMQSTNWSGYVVAGYMSGSALAASAGKSSGAGGNGGHSGGSGGSYTSAELSWVVPSVSYGPSTDSTNSPQYSANWVGIGGFCENTLCTKVDHSLIQLGTEQDVAIDGTSNYYAWYEMLPGAEILLSTTKYPVAPGDTMTASLSCGTTCSQKTQTWLLTMTDATRGWTWSQSVSYRSSQASAEWIEEAPYSGGILPLADFGTAPFSATGGANGVSPLLSVATNGIQMKDPWGQTSNLSDPDANADFNACWGFQTFTSCTAP